MVKIVFLVLMAIVCMALCYEIGFCHGYEMGKNKCEKFVKGNEHEEKSD